MAKLCTRAVDNGLRLTKEASEKASGYKLSASELAELRDELMSHCKRQSEKQQHCWADARSPSAFKACNYSGFAKRARRAKRSNKNKRNARRRTKR